MLFMAPEQVEGHATGKFTDVYQYGLLLYALSTGKVPFEGDIISTTLARRLVEKPLPPGNSNPDLPEWFERVVLRCLAIKPADRTTSMATVLQCLRKKGDHPSLESGTRITAVIDRKSIQVARDSVSSTREPSLPLPGEVVQQFPPPEPRHRWVLSAAGALVFLLAGFALAEWMQDPPPASPGGAPTPGVSLSRAGRTGPELPREPTLSPPRPSESAVRAVEAPAPIPSREGMDLARALLPDAPMTVPAPRPTPAPKPSGDGAESVSHLYEKGLALAKRGDHAGAIAVWTGLLEKRGDELTPEMLVKVNLALARSCCQTKKWNEALACLSGTRKISSEDERVNKLWNLILGRTSKEKLRQYFANRFVNARSLLENALLSEKASAGSGAASFRKASQLFRRAVEYGYDLAEADYCLGVCLLHGEGKVDEAMTYLNWSALIDASRSDVWYQLALANGRKGDVDAEIASLEHCQSLGRDDVQIWVALAKACGRRCQPSDADKVLVLVMRILRFDVSYATGLADAMRDPKLALKVRELVKKALQIEELKRQQEAALYEKKRAQAFQADEPTATPYRWSNVGGKPVVINIDPNDPNKNVKVGPSMKLPQGSKIHFS